MLWSGLVSIPEQANQEPPPGGARNSVYAGPARARTGTRGSPPGRAWSTATTTRRQHKFLSVDPTVLKTVQAYSFANDDPVNDTDPLGRCASCLVSKVASELSVLSDLTRTFVALSPILDFTPGFELGLVAVSVLSGLAAFALYDSNTQPQNGAIALGGSLLSIAGAGIDSDEVAQALAEGGAAGVGGGDLLAFGGNAASGTPCL